MIIGNFKKTGTGFEGCISTFSFEGQNVTFRANEGKTLDKHPDFRITAETESGSVELGSAWKRTSERGQEYLSVSLDGPLLNRAVNARLFLGEEGKPSTLNWSRQKEAEAKAPASKKAA